MTYWDLYNKRLCHLGETDGDRLVTQTLRNYKKLSALSPMYNKVIINNKEVAINILSTDYSAVRKFQSIEYKDIKLGDYVIWKNNYWIVTTINTDDVLYVGGEITRCNKLLCWQDQQTLDVIQKWCVVQNPSATLRVIKDDYISYPYKTYKILIPTDRETIMLDLDRRFLIDIIGGKPKSYKITGVDVMSEMVDNAEGGFSTLYIEQDQFNPDTDNAELMIADYKQKPSENKPDKSTNYCVIHGNNTIKLGGLKEKYSVEFYNDKGKTDPTIQANWEIEIQDEYKSFIQYNIQDNVININVKNNYKLLNKEFILKVTDINNTYPVTELKIKVVSVI